MIDMITENLHPRGDWEGGTTELAKNLPVFINTSEVLTEIGCVSRLFMFDDKDTTDTATPTVRIRCSTVANNKFQLLLHPRGCSKYWNLMPNFYLLIYNEIERLHS